MCFCVLCSQRYEGIRAEQTLKNAKDQKAITRGANMESVLKKQINLYYKLIRTDFTEEKYK